MSSTSGGSSPAGIAMANGLVPSSGSAPPASGMWLALATAEYMPIMSAFSGSAA